MTRHFRLHVSVLSLMLLSAAPHAVLAQQATSPAATVQTAPAPAVTVPDPAAMAVAQSIRAAFQQYLFDPALLSKPEFVAMDAQMMEAAAKADSVETFRKAFNALWRKGPLSHVVLRKADAPVDQTMAFLDTLRVGEGARLDWNGDVAVLTVKTMMGLDTIEQIDAAYVEIAARKPKALIIDLRANEGGAFAVVPLVQHLLKKPLDAGVFVARPWAVTEGRAPTPSDIRRVRPWTGWSIRDFWRSVREDKITRITFAPQGPHYGGPVYVLTSKRTASAAEMAADALKGTGHATLIGEQTAGKMLSQMPVDLPHGMQLYLPVADYYAFRGGRIEGQGVAPDIAISADAAMDEALARARR
ncbi:MAG: S41 family peptidase [Asticcacaulis sp.]